MPVKQMLPQKAKMTALVCSGRSRPNVSCAMPDVGRPPGKLEGDEDADQHAHDGPGDGGNEEQPDDGVVVFDGRRRPGSNGHD